MADVDPALGQQILDVAQRQWVSHVHHHDQTDDLRRAVEDRDGLLMRQASIPAQRDSPTPPGVPAQRRQRRVGVAASAATPWKASDMHEARVEVADHRRLRPAIRGAEDRRVGDRGGLGRPSLEFQSGSSSTQGMAFSRGVGLPLKEKNTAIESRPAVFRSVPLWFTGEACSPPAKLPLSACPIASSHCLVAPARNFLDRVLSHNCVTPIGPFAEGRHAVVAFAELGRRRGSLIATP